jgi:hypothetical protein
MSRQARHDSFLENSMTLRVSSRAMSRDLHLGNTPLRHDPSARSVILDAGPLVAFINVRDMHHVVSPQ